MTDQLPELIKTLHDLAVALAAKYYPEVTQWRPEPDALGLIFQIDNMTTGLIRADTAIPKAEADAMVGAALDRAVKKCADAFAEHMTAAVCGLPDNSPRREAAASMAERLLHEMRALRNSDARAAFEQAVREAVEERDRLIAGLVEALKWMVDNDETNEGDEPMPDRGNRSWNEINAYGLEGLNKARAALEKAAAIRAPQEPSE